MTAKERVEKELDELVDRREKLMAFLDSEKYLSLTSENKQYLIIQSRIMSAYIDVLKARLMAWVD